MEEDLFWILREPANHNQVAVADEVALLNDDVAAMFNDLGVLMAVRGNVEEAERFYRRSLEIRRRLLADDHPELTLTRRNLAVLPTG
ncbi:tetratricopeptide repeat protein [Actinocrispum wychmicini]|nr:tetratricopeptide repeat protein [Actinocrispum wychmicini]